VQADPQRRASFVVHSAIASFYHKSFPALGSASQGVSFSSCDLNFGENQLCAIDIRILIDLILILIAVYVSYRCYQFLLDRESPPVINHVDSKFTVASKKSCVIESISFFIVIDSIESNQVGLYLNIEIFGDYDTLAIDLPIKIKKSVFIDGENEEITAEEGESSIVFKKKPNTSVKTKINTLFTYGEISTTRELHRCRYIFQLYDFYVDNPPFEDGKFFKGVSIETYTPSVEKMTVIFSNKDDTYQPDPEKSLPFPNVFLPQEIRWYSGGERSNHSSINATFSNHTMLEISKRKYFIYSVLFTLASSASVAIVLDLVWSVFKKIS